MSDRVITHARFRLKDIPEPSVCLWRKAIWLLRLVFLSLTRAGSSSLSSDCAGRLISAQTHLKSPHTCLPIHFWLGGWRRLPACGFRAVGTVLNWLSERSSDNKCQ